MENNYYITNYIIHENGDIENSTTHRILKPYITSKGYCQVTLYAPDGSHKKFLVHRLVAQAHLPNPKNLPQINHRDMNKKNNSISNLEWCSAKHNLAHARANGKNIYTEERNLKISIAKRGIPMAEETKKKLSNYMRGLPDTKKTAITHRLHKNKPSKNCPLCLANC